MAATLKYVEAEAITLVDEFKERHQLFAAGDRVPSYTPKCR